MFGLQLFTELLSHIGIIALIHHVNSIKINEEEMLKKFLESNNILDNGKVLEVGCFNGSQLYEIENYNFSYAIGIDNDDELEGFIS